MDGQTDRGQDRWTDRRAETDKSDFIGHCPTNVKCAMTKN